MKSIEQLAVESPKMRRIPLGEITIVPGRNVRTVFEGIDELAQDIAANGQREPGTVRVNGEYVELVCGERRFRAIKLANEKYGAKIETYLCKPEPKGTNEETRIITMLSENNQVPLNALDEGAAYKRLVDYGWDYTKISAHTGRSPAYIAGRLDIAGATAMVREAVAEGTLSPTAAQKLSKATDSKQKKVIEKMRDKNTDRTGAFPVEKKKKISVEDVDRETKGHPSVITYGFMEKCIAEIEVRFKEAKEQYSDVEKRKEKQGYYKAVITGIKIAMKEITVEEI